MKRLPLILALAVSVAAVASEDWQAKCEAEGGCILITQRAYEHLLGQIEMLLRVIATMRQEQCA